MNVKEPADAGAPAPPTLEERELSDEEYRRRYGHAPYCPADFMRPEGPCECVASIGVPQRVRDEGHNFRSPLDGRLHCRCGLSALEVHAIAALSSQPTPTEGGPQ